MMTSEKGKIAMQHGEDVRIDGTMSDYIAQKLSDEEHGEKFAAHYLRADFLASAANALFSARKQAELTHEQLAERMGTKEGCISRWEGDWDGNMPLRHYVDFALACGAVPLMALEPLETVRKFVLEHSQTPITPAAYYEWLDDQKWSETVAKLSSGKLAARMREQMARGETEEGGFDGE